tara:strand:- start:78 stop:548 length:471 start_codon:yes stop_codon:yes gene_type:complete
VFFDQNLRLPHQTRQVCKSGRPAARTHTHEALVRRVAALGTFHTDVARLILGVRRAVLDRDRDSLLIFFVGVVLLGAAAAFDERAERLVVALLPVLLLALATAVARFTVAASRRLVFELFCAPGAFCDDHCNRGASWQTAFLGHGGANPCAVIERT